MWRSAVVLVLLLTTLAGCTGGSASDEAFCRRLADLPPDSRWEDSDLIVFVDPDASHEEVDAIRRGLDTTVEIDGYTWVDRQESYDEFVELFADSPEMVAAVGPEILPESARVRVRGSDPAAIRAVAGRLESRPGVYRVVLRGELDLSLIEMSVRPLTSERAQQMTVFTRGRTSIQLTDVAPGQVREAARVLDAFWADPTMVDGAPNEQVTDAARQITAYYDTECP